MSLVHTLLLTQAQTLLHSHTHSHSHTHTLTLTLTPTHIHSLTLQHTHTHLHSHSLTLTHTHSHSHTHTLLHSHSLTHKHSLTLTHTHTHTHQGDWSLRGSYDPTEVPSSLALTSMRRWLEARQAGVTRARADFMAQRSLTSMDNLGNVLFAAEVNLVLESMQSGFPNMINMIIPFVQLDMVSYSSYDTMGTPNFLPALQFIASHHNRTAAAPPDAVFIAEFGAPQNLWPNSTVVSTVQSVVQTALAFGCPYVLFWETYDNECTGGKGCSGTMHDGSWPPASTDPLRTQKLLGSGRCEDPDNPVTNPADLAGFWLVRPDNSTSWPFQYLASVIENQ